MVDTVELISEGVWRKEQGKMATFKVNMKRHDNQDLIKDINVVTLTTFPRKA